MSLAEPASAFDVTVLRWPDDGHVRRRLANEGRPRLLLVDEGEAPPALLDELEDWARSSAHPEDLLARRRELLRRAGAGYAEGPEVDPDGLLRVGRAWVALSPAQVPVVRLLVTNIERVVHYERLVTAYEEAGGSGHDASMRTMVNRVGARVRHVGLDLVTVRRRGVLLTASALRST